MNAQEPYLQNEAADFELRVEGFSRGRCPSQLVPATVSSPAGQ